MQFFTKIDRFLRTVCEQIRWEKAHNMIYEEMKNHIIDQKNAFMDGGLDEKTAVDRAIKEMGDPVLIGMELDQAHRPKTEWGIIFLTGIMLLFGFGIRLFVSHELHTPLLLGKNLISILIGTGCMIIWGDDLKKISILGSTGSIGTQALDVIRAHRGRFRIIGLAALRNIDVLEKQIEEFNPEVVAVFEKEKAEILSDRIDKKVKIVSGIEGLFAVATSEVTDIVITSVVGSIGLLPTLEAIRCKKTIALANKETLVVAGELVIKEAEKYDAKIIPVDSEHSAIFQCLQGEDPKNISRIILTGSVQLIGPDL